MNRMILSSEWRSSGVMLAERERERESKKQENLRGIKWLPKGI